MIGKWLLGLHAFPPLNWKLAACRPFSLLSLALPEQAQPIKLPSFVKRPKEAKSLNVTKIINASKTANPVLNAHS